MRQFIHDTMDPIIDRETSRRRRISTAETIPPPIAKCPDDPHEAAEWHRAIKADARTGNPVTPHAQNVLRTIRKFADRPDSIGECLCGSSLMLRGL